MSKKQLSLSIDINASKEKVWDVLLQDETYRKWTSVFCEGSYAEGSWNEGSKILFKTPQGDGMVSRIILNRPSEIISMEHYGILKNNIEDYESEDVKKWANSKETYKLESNGANKTKLTIEVEIADEHYAWFKETWLKGLDIVKELSEA